MTGVFASSARIAFRVDASLLIGTGHVMRCLTLADALRVEGADCLFLCRPHQGHLLALIAERGHRVAALPEATAPLVRSPADPAHADWLGTGWAQDAEDTHEALGKWAPDLLVVDHYGLDHRWEAALRSACRRIMVMDDLADRPHDCDLLLDPSLGREPADYAALLPHDAIALLGPRFALLRPEFAQLRAESLARRAQPALRHLLITMGGVDKDDATSHILDALDDCALPPDLRITAVLGAHSPWLAKVRERAARMRAPTQVRVDVRDMARLMADSDLAIGAAGGTSWERCCLGLPTIQLVLAENQMECAEGFIRAGAVIGISSTIRVREELPALIDQLDPNQLRHMSKQSAQICDGRGVSALIQYLLHLIET